MYKCVIKIRINARVKAGVTDRLATKSKISRRCMEYNGHEMRQWVNAVRRGDHRQYEGPEWRSAIGRENAIREACQGGPAVPPTSACLRHEAVCS